jgi:polysaccharide biosynthesis/export protein VpsN
MRKIAGRALLLTATVASLAFVGAASTTRAQGQTDPAVQSIPNPVLRPGDGIRIMVWRNAEMSGEFNVTAEGRLMHPFLGTVVVGGLPFMEVRERLRGIIQAQVQTDALFTIQPLLRVAVEGEVRQPNLYRHTPEVTIAEAIALAGGVTDRAKLSKVRLVRGRVESTFDMRDVKTDAMWRTVQSGDRIVVPRRTAFSWRVVLALVTAGVGIMATIANYFLIRARFE